MCHAHLSVCSLKILPCVLVIAPSHICIASHINVLACSIQSNLGGASDRPVPRDIWTNVQAKLADPDADEDALPIHRLGRRGVCSACTVL